MATSRQKELKQTHYHFNLFFWISATQWGLLGLYLTLRAKPAEN